MPVRSEAPPDHGPKDRGSQDAGDEPSWLDVGWRPGPAVRCPAASSLCAGLGNARLVGQHNQLDAVAKIEFLEDVRHVRLDGGLADVKFLADLRVGEPAS